MRIEESLPASVAISVVGAATPLVMLPFAVERGDEGFVILLGIMATFLAAVGVVVVRNAIRVRDSRRAEHS